MKVPRGASRGGVDYRLVSGDLTVAFRADQRWRASLSQLQYLSLQHGELMPHLSNGRITFLESLCHHRALGSCNHQLLGLLLVEPSAMGGSDVLHYFSRRGERLAALGDQTPAEKSVGRTSPE
jgi:hypothetical protein